MYFARMIKCETGISAAFPLGAIQDNHARIHHLHNHYRSNDLVHVHGHSMQKQELQREPMTQQEESLQTIVTFSYMTSIRII